MGFNMEEIINKYKKIVVMKKYKFIRGLGMAIIFFILSCFFSRFGRLKVYQVVIFSIFFILISLIYLQCIRYFKSLKYSEKDLIKNIKFDDIDEFKHSIEIELKNHNNKIFSDEDIFLCITKNWFIFFSYSAIIVKNYHIKTMDYNFVPYHHSDILTLNFDDGSYFNCNMIDYGDEIMKIINKT